MKKKVLGVVALVFLLALYINLYGCSAKAQEDSGAVIAPVEASKFFDEKVLPLLLQYGTVAVGVLSVVAPILGKINKSRKTFDAANAALEAVKADSENIKGKSLKKDGEITALKTQLTKEIDELRREVLAMTSSTNTIKKICEIAFVNNKDLVINGYASDIKKVVDNEENKKED